ncbi:MAG: phosphotransferase [Litorimonas sp.]
MSERRADLEAFLAQAGWGDATREPVAGDASTRRYTRLTLHGRRAVVMDAPRGDEAPGEAEGMTPALRAKLGYNALARLAGPNLEAFLAVAEQLTLRGFSAPQVYSADVDRGFALLEDLGEDDYWRVIHEDSGMERPLYEAAVDVLAAIHRSTFPRRPKVAETEWVIRDYDEAALLAETDLMLDWYVPDAGVDVGEAARDAWTECWTQAFKSLSAHAPGLCLRDFHAQNLFWLPDRTGQARVGLIDFQDALFAHPAYDLASLLEDARRDVDPALAEPMVQRFCDAAGLANDEAFQAAYAVTAAQRNAKILGIFVRLAERDGKTAYRALIPRVLAHFQRDLSHPACARVRSWFDAFLPELL